MSQQPSSPPKFKSILDGSNLKSIAKYINSADDGQKRKIIVLAGAGISTSAGIPDFRSPGTGLYSNLARFHLPYPEAVFDIRFFKENPSPFYALAKELNPGKFRPTITHSFIRLLAEKGLLLKCFTQNIDTLERRAGVPGDKVIEAHGSFATHSCISCHESFPDDAMQAAVEAQMIPYCEECGSLVKPNITFFGEGLPPNFFENIGAIAEADLIIILGTSLTVHPFASLPSMAPRQTPRLLINLEQVGGIGSRPNDVVHLGQCDAAVKELASELGWLEELEKIWEATSDSVDKGKAKAKEELDKEAIANKKEGQDDQDAKVSAQVDAISKAIQERLRLIDEFTEQALADLALDDEDEGVREYDGYEEWDEYGLDSDPEGDKKPSASDTPNKGSASLDAAKVAPATEPKAETGKSQTDKPSSSSVPPTSSHGDTVGTSDTSTTKVDKSVVDVAADKDKVNP